MKLSNVIIKNTSKHREIKSELLQRIYNKARRLALEKKPVRTHYNAHSFG